MKKYLLLVLSAVVIFIAVGLIIIFFVSSKKNIKNLEEDKINTPLVSSSAAVVDDHEIISGVKSVLYEEKDKNFKFWYPETAVISHNEIVPSVPRVSLTSSMFANTNLNEAYVEIDVDSSLILEGSDNLGSDYSYKNVIEKCLQPRDWEKSQGTTNILGKDFDLFVGNDAGAGNLYESRSYRRVQNNHCYEINAVLHSGNIGNYVTGAVKEFDKFYFTNVLDRIVASFDFLN